MKRIIILLLCCGVLISVVGCGGNTAPPPTESPPTMVSETAITENPLETIPPVTAVKPTEKDPVTTEREEQVTEPTVVATEPTTTRPTEETTTTTSAVGEKSTSPIEETVPSTTPQLTEEETTETEPHKNELKAETESPKEDNFDRAVNDYSLPPYEILTIGARQKAINQQKEKQKRNITVLKVLCWGILPLVCLALVLLDAFGIYTFSTLRLVAIGAGAVITLIPCFKEIKIGEISLKNQIEKQKEETKHDV